MLLWLTSRGADFLSAQALRVQRASEEREASVLFAITDCAERYTASA